ncbi:hypothetical protein BG003_001745 [Podila horticola]|nr:hypothetical protein BG003_001745 [Podila horticola]
MYMSIVRLSLSLLSAASSLVVTFAAPYFCQHRFDSQFRLDSPKYLAVAKVTLKVNYPFTVDDYTSQPLAVKAFDDKIYIAGLDGAIFTPLELRVVHADEECSTKTESPDCVKDGTEDGTKYLIRTSTDSHKGYLGVSKGFIQVFSSYADASYSMLIVNGDKVRIRYRNAENSEYTVVSMSPKIPIGIQSLKRLHLAEPKCLAVAGDPITLTYLFAVDDYYNSLPGCTKAEFPHCVQSGIEYGTRGNMDTRQGYLFVAHGLLQIYINYDRESLVRLVSDGRQGEDSVLGQSA